jgi:predicted ester cyclase
MDGHRMFELAQALAIAKSRHDVPAALRLLHPGMVLTTPAFGTAARGTAENERTLTRFFASFPDYDVELHGHAGTADNLICWGTARMTMTGDRFGVVPNGRRAELPVFIEFGFRDDLIASERFCFDLSALCAQSGVSTDAVRQRIFGEPAPPGSGEPTPPSVGDLTPPGTGPIVSTPLFELIVDLKPPVDMGRGPLGRRVLYGAAGGSFEGPRLRGEVLAQGGDWALFRSGGVMTLDVRLALRTDDGALLHMTYGGRFVTPPELRTELADPAARYQIDPARYYFRTNPLFETAAQRYAWMNDIVCVGSGYLVEGGIGYRVAQVL